MADFVQKANIKSAVRTLANPIEDVASFDAIVQTVITTNLFAKIRHIYPSYRCLSPPIIIKYPEMRYAGVGETPIATYHPADPILRRRAQSRPGASACKTSKYMPIFAHGF
jgi:hypothetical protein